LVREVRAKGGTPVWRRDDAGQSYALKLTAAGLKAIAVDDGPDEATASKETPQIHPRATKATGPDVIGEPDTALAPRAGSKLARVIDLLRRPEGATILDLTDATGWLPHTTRAALTGLRKRGYAIARERLDGGRTVYRIVARTPDGADSLVANTAPSDGPDRELKPKAASRAA
jgi:Protein of unknown function (DUF3489)